MKSQSAGRYSPMRGIPAPSLTPPAAPAGRAHAPALRDLLQAAAETVRSSWEHEVRDGHTAADLAEPLAAVCAALGQVVEGGTPETPRLPTTLAAGRLMDRLRRAFLHCVETLPEPPDGADLLAMFAAFEQVQALLHQDVAHRFAKRLGDSDGLQLLVEVAHDMRSPLGSILFLVERLRSGQSGVVTSIQERQLGLIYTAAFGLCSMATDVIELARGGDRLTDHEPVPFSVAELLQSVRDIVQPMAEEKGLALRFVPPESDSRLGFPAALHRVLLNLTTNALKFTASGSVEVRCRSVSRSELEFSVRDTGRGIPPEVLATLFETFRRRSRPGDYTFSSAGLGLSICQKLVQAMQGELHVDTGLDSGTRFHFTLDLPPASAL